ncbi:MAG TPA: TIGR01777 family oxidoreductase [Methylomirabilota bacterium]|nr:TIGR01777 family oxidoreductase [Methylomirabilota bacterium]
MKILLTGATGFIGSALAASLSAEGHEVVGLGRDLASFLETTAATPSPAPGPFAAVIHLAGQSIAGRWTPERKAALRSSRVELTRRLCEWLAAREPRPGTLICASAVGYYGDRSEETVDEDSPAGTGFLADLCRDWEGAAAPARAVGLRVVHLRFGIVLDARGGALARMLPLFRLGLGGRIGSGRQWWAWISLDDALGVIRRALTDGALAGPLNVVAPAPVTNSEFTRALAAAVRRPAILPAPAWSLRLVFGEMADQTLLASTRAVPTRLQAAGFAFRHPELCAALRRLLAG